MLFSLLVLLPLRAQDVEAKFEYAFSSQQSNTVYFYNFSEGDLAGATWTFGDGEYASTLADTLTHTFAETDFYQVCLTVWDDAGSLHEYCEEIFVGPANMICNYTDCVFPGDANGDGVANLYDMLHMGLGLGHQGPVRPNASLDWYGQPAPDWGQYAPGGVDFKHLDADGNGQIQQSDLEAIFLHNNSLPKQPQISDNDGPTIFLDFKQDTIFLQDYAGQDTIHLLADIHLGDVSNGFDDLHGISFYVDYEEELFMEYEVEVTYDEESFTGKQLQDVAVGWKDQKGSSQLDFGLTRINQQAASGGGKVGQARFIIVSDIIEARTTNEEVEVEFPLRGVKTYNSFGEPVLSNVTKFPATVYFIEGTVTSTQQPDLEKNILVYPNPTADFLRIRSGSEMQPYVLTLYNTVGVPVYRSGRMENRQPVLDLRHLPKGVYQLQLETDKGVLVKQIIKQ